MKIISENIRMLRQRQGLSQEQLAHLSNVNTSYLGQIERHEKNNPTINMLNKIARGLGLESYESLSFDSESGGEHQSIENQMDSNLIETLRTLKQLCNEGVINETEFEDTKKQILSKL